MLLLICYQEKQIRWTEAFFFSICRKLRWWCTTFNNNRFNLNYCHASQTHFMNVNRESLFFPFEIRPTFDQFLRIKFGLFAKSFKIVLKIIVLKSTEFYHNIRANFVIHGHNSAAKEFSGRWNDVNRPIHEYSFEYKYF